MHRKTEEEFDVLFNNLIQKSFPLLIRIRNGNREEIQRIYNLKKSDLTSEHIDLLVNLEIEQEITLFIASLDGFLYAHDALNGTQYKFVNGVSKSVKDFSEHIYEDFPELLEWSTLLFKDEKKEPSQIKQLRNKYNDVDFCSLPEELDYTEDDLNQFIQYFQSNQAGLPIEEIIKKDLKSNSNKEELFVRLLIWFDNLEESIEIQKADKKKSSFTKSDKQSYSSPFGYHFSDYPVKIKSEPVKKNTIKESLEKVHADMLTTRKTSSFQIYDSSKSLESGQLGKIDVKEPSVSASDYYNDEFIQQSSEKHAALEIEENETLAKQEFEEFAIVGNGRFSKKKL